MKSKFKVVVVDDNEIQLVLMANIFKDEFIISYCFSTTDNILDKIKEIDPDLIVLDLVMPDKSGLEVCKELQQDKDTQTIPVVLVSGSTEIQDKLFSMHLGCIDYFTKPLDAKSFINKITNYAKIGEIFKLCRKITED